MECIGHLMSHSFNNECLGGTNGGYINNSKYCQDSGVQTAILIRVDYL